ncbi:MAG: MCE family protein [Rhodospirillales bacterium]|nr:MCE family protein [Rhodospirillales bacterium]
MSETDAHPDLEAAGLADAAVKQKRRFSLIWLIPIVAAIAGAYLVYTTFANRGPLITITFPNASGIEPGKTQIKYRDVNLGTVQTVSLSEDLGKVIVTARMSKEAEDHLRNGTTFWIESARITAGGVTGLSTLLSGSYIGMRPGEGNEERHFAGLETPPLYQVTIPGKNVTLKAKTLGSISAGAPIYFRGIEVGGVLGHHLAEDGNSVTIYGFVRAPFDKLVREKSEFWNASGIDFSLSAAGVDVRTESLTSILVGGIAFDTPSDESDSTAATDGETFPLYSSYAEIAQAKFTLKVPFLVYFDGSVSGLEPGAPVSYRGMKLGEVKEIQLQVDPTATTVMIPVRIELEPQRWMTDEAAAVSPNLIAERMGKWVERGLRAQLQSGNLLTGQKIVALEMMPNAKKASLTFVDGIAVIPTVPGEFEVLTDKVSAFLDELDKAPIGELVADARDAVQEAEALLGSPALRKGIDGLQEVGPLLESLKQTADAATATLDDAQLTVQSANAILGPDAPLRYDLNRMLKELTNTARSLRALADFLERNPDAIILGKPLPEKP